MIMVWREMLMASLFAVNTYKYAYVATRGFTLVELLVVMAVIGVLAAGLIALVNPVDRINQANDSKVLSDVNQMVKGVQLFVANNQGTYPLQAAAANWTAVGASVVADNDLTVAPAALAGRNYGGNCAQAGPCKLAVQLLAKKYLAAGAGVAQACWLSSAGTVQLLNGANGTVSTTATCP